MNEPLRSIVSVLLSVLVFEQVRNRLEKSIALYIATTNRPEILVKARAASPWLGTVKGKWREIVEEGEATPGSELGGYGEGEGEGGRGADDHLFEEASDLWWSSIEWLEKHLAPNAFGFETVDAIDYYVAELKALNSKVCFDY